MALLRLWRRRRRGPSDGPTKSLRAEPRSPTLLQTTDPPSPVASGDGLRLENERPAPPSHPRPRGTGFDPYASDAGFAKPHSWERVDHD